MYYTSRPSECTGGSLDPSGLMSKKAVAITTRLFVGIYPMPG